MAAAFIAGCAPDAPAPAVARREAQVPAPDVFATHEPMHPGTGVPVTLSAQADTPKITLRYQRSTLQLQSDGEIKETIVETMKDVEVCSGTQGVVTTCKHTIQSGFPEGSLIRFDAVAELPNGIAGTESYFFAAGQYPTADAAIPVRLKATTGAGLDVVFIGTPDLTEDELRSSLKDIIHDVYFKDGQVRNSRAVYNFYYSGMPGRYREACEFDEPANMDVLEATGDAIVFLHQSEMQDCQSGKRISSETSNQKSMIHESGHVLFDLQDEYCCGSNYAAQSCVPNLWSTQQSCQTAAQALGHPVTACTQLTDGSTTLEFWRIDPDGETGCIMGTGTHFQAACQRRIAWRHQKCLRGRCFTTPACP